MGGGDSAKLGTSFDLGVEQFTYRGVPARQKVCKQAAYCAGWQDGHRAQWLMK